MKTSEIEGADLFCGAGGTSEGMMRAAEERGVKLNLLAINHWDTAVSSHSLNHPAVRHRCESLDAVNPRKAVPGGRLHIMAASPECTGHSAAAGGMPRNEQSRATAWHVTRWISDLIVDNVLMENVREFLDWGPLLERGITWRGRYYKKGRPDPRRKGETFKAFIRALEGMNYRVEYRIQCAADFGDPTSRRRLIIMARRNGRQIRWPEPTHGPGRLPHRTAREIIDWSIESKSIFGRRRPLCANTLHRIEVGLKKFCSERAQPFLVKLYGTNTAASIDDPLPTITAGGNHFGLAQPFLTKFYGTGTAVSIDEPLDTVTTKDRFALVQPKEDGVDILFRILEPHELQQAMSFPRDYRFCGTKGDQVKQIGNAVPVELAKAHTIALLSE